MKRNDGPVILAWIVLIVVLATIAFQLMRRDAGQGFGGFAYGGIPYFELQDLNGEERSLHKMKGKVWLLHFVSSYRREPDAETVKTLRRLHQRFGGRDNFQIVSVSTDPARLTSIASILDEKGAESWHLLHGSAQDIEGFMADNFHIDTREDMFQLDQMVFLIDQHATIRGYYKVDTAKQLPAMERHLQSLL